MATYSHAAPAVFDIYELAERILTHLEATDLVHARRVDSCWKAVIDRSDTLQRALFRTPDTPQTYLLWVNRSRPRAYKPSQPVIIMTMDRLKTANIIVKLHPLLKAEPFFQDSWSKTEVILSFNAARITGHADGAWQDAFISQPPIRFFHATVMFKDQETSTKNHIHMPL